MELDKLTDCFDISSKLIIRINNQQTFLNKGDDKFESIINSLKNTTKHSHEMPAFGVSIDDETRKEIVKGVWIELIFDGTYDYNEMPFESLLIKVDKDDYGFNLIRKNNGKYEGRCFYISLNNSMRQLYETIAKIFNNVNNIN